jgi:hypothetical protein
VITLIAILAVYCSLISASEDIPASCKMFFVRHTAKVPRVTPLWWTGSRFFSVEGDADP